MQGKTTLIRLNCGLQEPRAGEYTLYRRKNTDGDIAKSCIRMGAVVKTPYIYLDMSVEDNLKMQYRIIGLPSFYGMEDLLRLVGLESTGKKKAKNFSPGMRQRLGLAISRTLTEQLGGSISAEYNDNRLNIVLRLQCEN